MSSLSVVMRVRNGELEVDAPPSVTSSSDTPTSSTSDDDHPSNRRVDAAPRKKLTTTYNNRKEEIVSLHSEYDALVQQVEQLQGARQSDEMVGIMQAVETHTMLQRDLHQAGLLLAGTRSLLANTLEHNPLHTYIRLTRNTEQREFALRAVREPQLRKATEYLLERVRFQDLHRSSNQSDVSEAANGDIVFTRFDVTPIASARSVHQIHDQLLWFMRHQEYLIWEKLGVSSYCEVDTFDENGRDDAGQMRLVSSMLGDAVVMEKNLAIFRSFHAQGSDLLPIAHGLVVIESIDDDEPFPYQPANRARMDLSCAMLVVAAPPRFQGDTQSTVAIVRCAFKRLHKPQCPITPHQHRQIQQLIPQWGDTLCDSVREFVMGSMGG